MIRHFRESAPLRSWWANFLPIPVTALILGLEIISGAHTRVTVSLMIASMAIYAMILSPRALMIWCLLLLPVVGAVEVYYNWPALEAHRRSLPTILLHLFAFIVVGIIAAKISATRTVLTAELADVLRIFDLLPDAMVVSDSDGNIVFANKISCEILGLSRNEVAASPYFTLFTAPEHRGLRIERYLEMFRGGESFFSLALLVLTPTGREERHGKCMIVAFSKRKYLVTLFWVLPVSSWLTVVAAGGCRRG